MHFSPIAWASELSTDTRKPLPSSSVNSLRLSEAGEAMFENDPSGHMEPEKRPPSWKWDFKASASLDS